MIMPERASCSTPGPARPTGDTALDPLLVRWWPEAARAIGVSRTRMAELISTGQVESVKDGRRRLVPPAALRAYVDRLLSEQRTAATANEAGTADDDAA